MIIEKDKKIMLLRFSDYKYYDFIAEHLKIISETGHVWAIKVGKSIPTTRLNELFREPNYLILRGPKHKGGKYYVANVIEAFNGLPRNDMKYPDYYEKLMKDINMWLVSSMEGTWFCLTEIIELPVDVIPFFRLTSNNKLVEEVLNSTRSSIVYVSSERDIRIEP